MDISANAEQIISQAEQWTFAGDCALLQWMEQIGKNLEQRATTTNKNFDELSSNLKQTGIALGNVTNSLAALQYTQFVESRVHDDDETIANVTDVPVDIVNHNDEPKDSDVLWKTILNKNLEVLRNCHERYSLDLEDSDGEEEEAANNFIYQPKNPYNERLLPHIYGTKLWNENWHVGLCDDSNSYSGDEISETFSESSSSQAEDNESFESNSAHLAEWASTTSIANEKQQQQQPIRIQNASSLRGSQSIYPPVQENSSKTIAFPTIESSSAVSVAGQMSVKQNDPRFDMFAPVRDSPPPPSLSSSSSASSLQQPQFQNFIQSNNNERRDSAEYVRKPDKITTTGNSTYAPPIKRRPVNLFDDDDFSSFLTEIVDKSTSRESTVTHNDTTSKIAKKESQQEQEPICNASVPNTKPIQINPQTNKKPPTINLFDSPDASPRNEVFNAKAKSSEEVIVANSEVNIVRPKLITKTLFDDDDDDDFMAIFGAKKQNIAKPPVTKLNLFDDDDDEDKTLPSIENAAKQTIERKTKTQEPQEKNKLFQATENIRPNDFFTKNKSLVVDASPDPNKLETHEEDNLFSKKSQRPVDLFVTVDVPEDVSNPAFQQKTDLFSSEDDDDLFKSTFEQTIQKSAKISVAKVGDIKEITSSITQDTHDELKENTETPATIANNEQRPKDADAIHGASGDSIVAHQNENVIDKQNKEIVKENVEVILTNDEKNPAEIPIVPQDTSVPIQNQTKNTYTDLFLNEPPDDDDDDSAFFQTLDSNVLSGSGLTAQHFDQDIYEPALPVPPAVDRASNAKPNPSSSYGNLGLFSDVPPDDDDMEDISIDSANISSNNETKRIHSIFYDDFTETMEALNSRQIQETNPTLHSIFSDEPPPDDGFESFLQNPAKFSEVKTTVAKEVIAKPEERTSPKNIPVSKLKIPNININVQALLPGANQKSQLRKSLEREEPTESVSTVESLKTNLSSTISQPTEIKRDSAENILVNVCKHRVRAPARRRPSTRHGRQENYRKSLASEQEEELYVDEKREQKNAKSLQQHDKETIHTTIENNREVTKDFSRTHEETEYTKTSAVLLPTETIPRVASQKLITELLNEVEEKTTNKNIEAALNEDKTKSNSLFNDDDNDDSDFLFGSSVKNTIKESPKHESPPLLSQEAEGDNPTMQAFISAHNSNIPNTNIKDERHETPVFAIESEATKEPTNNNRGNELFKKAESYTAVSKESTIRTISASGGLFDDDDDDDDFIFTNKKDNTSRLFLNPAKPQSQYPKDVGNENECVMNSQSHIENANNKSFNIPTPVNLVKKHYEKPEIKSSKETERPATSKSERNAAHINIFGDSDDDDDDSLFSSSASKLQPQVVIKTTISSVGTDRIEPKSAGIRKITAEQPNKLETPVQVKSIFGSDDDDDDAAQNDDKFLNAIKNHPKLKTRLTKATEKDDGKTLFSDADDDDDDDLFGSKTTKATLPNSTQATNNKKPLMQPGKSMPSAALTADNPLADLLFND